MLSSLSRGQTLALTLSLSMGAIAVSPALAVADDEEEEEDGGGEGEEKGGEEPEEDDDKGQPALTAGGLYTMKTYPISEIVRPLTMTQGITQLRLTLGTDLSAKGAF